MSAAGRPVVSTDIAGLRWLRDCADGLDEDDIVIVRSPGELAGTGRRSAPAWDRPRRRGPPARRRPHPRPGLHRLALGRVGLGRVGGRRRRPVAPHVHGVTRDTEFGTRDDRRQRARDRGVPDRHGAAGREDLALEARDEAAPAPGPRRLRHLPRPDAATASRPSGSTRSGSSTRNGKESPPTASAGASTKTTPAGG